MIFFIETFGSEDDEATDSNIAVISAAILGN